MKIVIHKNGKIFEYEGEDIRVETHNGFLEINATRERRDYETESMVKPRHVIAGSFQPDYFEIIKD